MSMYDNSFIRSFCGGRLAEGRLVRKIYIDEAGTSLKETVAVVAGVVINGDSDWRIALEYLNFLKVRYVPPQLHPSHAFHATDIFSGVKTGKASLYKEGYRWRILDRLLSAPRKLGLGVVWGYWRKEASDEPLLEMKLRHIKAFALCLKAANDFMRLRCPGEIADVVAEDVTHMRGQLATVMAKMRSPNASSTFKEMNLNLLVDSVLFAKKKEAPLLQLADAVAFALRHQLSDGKHRERLMRSLIVDSYPPLFDFSGKAGSGFMTRHSGQTILLPRWPFT